MDHASPVDRFRMKLREALPQLNARFHVRSLGLFGSYVRGEQTEESDLDVLVDFDETPTLLEFIKLENVLTDLLGVKVDLVMQGALKPHIGARILEDVKPV